LYKNSFAQRSLSVVVTLPQLMETAVDGDVAATLLLPQTPFRQQRHLHLQQLVNSPT